MKDKADCYVLTASYKEEDASGEEAVMHDESALIPESVKPFGFGQYDIRERKPDMVFTTALCLSGPRGNPAGL